MSTLAASTHSSIDLRTIAPRDRHAVVFGRADALPPGQSLQLLADHDPQPLRSPLDERARGQFEWTTLESGPAVWRVQITRVGIEPPVAARGSCCGACGG